MDVAGRIRPVGGAGILNHAHLVHRLCSFHGDAQGGPDFQVPGGRDGGKEVLPLKEPKS